MPACSRLFSPVPFALALALALVAAWPAGALAFSTSPFVCSADGAAVASSVHGNARAGFGGFSLSTTTTEVASGGSAVIRLSRTSASTFKGLLLYATDRSGNKIGTWTLPNGYGPVSGCGPGVVGQTSSTAKSLPVNFTWTAPVDPALAFATFHAMVVVSISEYYLLDTLHVAGPGHLGVAGDEPGLELGASRPSPFANSTALDYTLPRELPVRLDILDVSGRVVSRLDEGLRAAGTHSASWDARDAARRPVRSGVYFARLQAGSAVRVRRVVHLAN